MGADGTRRDRVVVAAEDLDDLAPGVGDGLARDRRPGAVLADGELEIGLDPIPENRLTQHDPIASAIEGPELPQDAAPVGPEPDVSAGILAVRLAEGS